MSNDTKRDEHLVKEVYYLSDYNWERGHLISEGPKNLKVRSVAWGHEVRVPKDKCAAPEESVCVVWEMWRGRNGRGGYRVERSKYPEHRVRADQISRQSSGAGRVNEREKPEGV